MSLVQTYLHQKTYDQTGHYDFGALKWVLVSRLWANDGLSP